MLATFAVLLSSAASRMFAPLYAIVPVFAIQHSLGSDLELANTSWCGGEMRAGPGTEAVCHPQGQNHQSS